MGVGGQDRALAILLPGKRLGIQCTGGWMGTGPVCTGMENFTPTRIQCADHSAHSGLLHQLCYPGPFCTKVLRKNFNSYMFITFLTICYAKDWNTVVGESFQFCK